MMTAILKQQVFVGRMARTPNMNCVKNQIIFDFFYGLAEQ